MPDELIDWNASIEQQIDEIVVLLDDAQRLMRQIQHKKYTRPDLITDEHYSRFQSVISSTHNLIRGFENNPLYRRALLQLCSRQKQAQKRTIAKYFESLVGTRRSAEN